MNDISRTLLFLGSILSCFGIPYLVALGASYGWHAARNKSVKVCDVCWRDIQKVNEHIKNKSL